MPNHMKSLYIAVCQFGIDFSFYSILLNIFIIIRISYIISEIILKTFWLSNFLAKTNIVT